jgi:glycosyltransferase involved in cell wall biosynthesis
MLVSAFTRYDREAASTRQRLLQYLPYLERAGIQVDVHPMLDNGYVRALVTGARSSKTSIATAYARRFCQLLGPQSADLIWVYGEMFPWLPAVAERLAFRAGIPVVYDFDDAFFHAYDDNANPFIRRMLGGKLKPLMRASSAVCAGNSYLKDYAEAAGAEAIVLPTVVDIDAYVPAKSRTDRPLTIGWIGSPSTWEYVHPLLPLLADLCRARGVRFRVVGAGSGAKVSRFRGMTLEPWSEHGEIAAVQDMDIGIMPLPDKPWARGKSGYKLVQYMACGLPVVASPVGVNATIVEHGVTGLLATDIPQWRVALTCLIDHPSLRSEMGKAGRARAVQGYSLQAHAPRLIKVLRGAVGL